MKKFHITLEVEAETLREAEKAAEGIADATETVIVEVKSA